MESPLKTEERNFKTDLNEKVARLASDPKGSARSSAADPTRRSQTAQSTARTDQKLALKYRRISSLELNPNNPRLHSDKQIRQIAESILAFGFNVPVLVDFQGKVIAGHGRVLACQQLGIEEVPTIMLETLTEMQARAFMIADNKLTENSEWDQQLLAEQFKILADFDFSVEITGFEMAEVDTILENVSPPSNGEEEPADELPEQTNKVQVSQPDDLWQLGTNRLLCADATRPSSYIELMAGKKAGAGFTDPPYNVHIDGHVTGLGRNHHPEFPMASGEMTESEFTDFLTNGLRCMAANCVDGAIGYVCMDWRHVSELLAACNLSNLEVKNLCVWVKDNAGMGSFYRSQHELIFVLKNGTGRHRNNVQLGQFGRYRTNVWQYPGANSFSRNTEEGNLLALHPTVKPVAMVADAIMDCSARGDIILDGFLGSGTTLIAAERTGRVCYGLELDPKYVDTSIRRWQAFTGKTAVHLQSGRTFNELEREKSNG